MNESRISRFSGIYPALLTPFRADGTIHEASLRALVRLNLEKGVTGFYVGGSTAEAFLLESAQRRQILEIVADEVKGRARLIAHIGTISQNTAVELAKHARDCGADAISSIAPFYYEFPFSCIRDYYYALADAVDIPVLMYHFPASSGVQLTVDHVSQFLTDPRFMGIKYTSGDLFMLSQLREKFPDALIFNGYDEIFLSGLTAGANGGIGSTYNFMAEKFIRLRQLFAGGQMEEARLLQQEANRVIAALIHLGVMPAEKAALSLMGIDMGQCLPPFQQLAPEQIRWLEGILRENHCL